MKKWLKNSIAAIAIILGIVTIKLAEIDDSPGGMLIGLIIALIAAFILLKENNLIKKK